MPFSDMNEYGKNKVEGKFACRVSDTPYVETREQQASLSPVRQIEFWG